MTEEEYRAEQAARQTLTDQTLKVTSSVPTPTQEELDMTRLGLMHPDDMADPNNPEMPSLRLQQAFIENAIETAHVPDRPTPAPSAPVNVTVPYVAGAGTVGATLSCTMGTWEGEPTSYAYAWQSDGEDLGNAGNSYEIAASDAGHSLTCIVTATNAGGSTAAPPSNAVAVNAGTRQTGARR
jgi:hypothetical protein